MTTSNVAAQVLVRAYLRGRSMDDFMFAAAVDTVAGRLVRGIVPVLDQALRRDIDSHASAAMLPQRHLGPVHHAVPVHLMNPSNIYLIDDHPTMRDAIAMMMRRVYPLQRVIEFGCLTEFLSNVGALGPPGLILLDLNLPDSTGCSGVHKVRQRFPDVLLAVYSASRAEEAERDCIEAGADFYIEKSTGSRELFAALRGLLTETPLSRPHVTPGQERSRLEAAQ
jgi:CheY-like chemotaxis protein